ncbi:MAG TPA: hypothetical protein VM681_10350 [Candidatus Thermoplasmatota archaeon]|nr:hypothetical protein [Candidatus Thermoplasmatota archaeon]
MRSVSRRRDDERGVTVVVGTILLVAMLVATLSMAHVYQIPAAQKSAEGARVRILGTAMADLKASIDRLTEDGTPTPVSVALPVSQVRASFLGLTGPASGGHVLSFGPGNRPFTISAPSVRLVDAPGPSEVWRSTGTSLSGAYGFESLRLNVNQVGAGHDDHWIRATVRDGANAFAGSFELRQAGSPPSYVLRAKVCSAAGCGGEGLLYDQGVGQPGSTSQSNYRVNLLHPDYRFDRVLAAAAPPIRIEWATSGFAGQYAAVWTDAAGASRHTDGSPAGSGVLVQNYSRTLAGGAFSLAAGVRYVPGSEYVLENGALLLRQGDGAVLKAPPPFAVQTLHAGGVDWTAVTLAVPTLRGPGFSFSVDGVAVARSTAVGEFGLTAHAPSVTLSVTTDEPDLWIAAWRGALSAAGLVEDEGYTLSKGGRQASVTVLGRSPSPSTFDVSLSLVQVDVLFEVTRG